jgi:hypothetical protein
MISQNQIRKSSLKHHINFEMQCLDNFLAMSNDEFSLVDENELLENDQYKVLKDI